jgi:hypothetical protein
MESLPLGVSVCYFLAVFAGFLAENWREHAVEKRGARQLFGKHAAGCKNEY